MIPWILSLLTALPHDGSERSIDLDSWSQWRGPTRDGRVGGSPWPTVLEGQLERRWRVEMGPSYSGPILASDRIFTTSTEDGEREVVRAFALDSGELLWETSWPGAMSVPFFAARNGSWIRATPAYDGEFVFVAGMRDVLVCLDAETGEIVWRVDFCERYGTPLPDFGFVSSPLVDGDTIYVQAGSAVCKLDRTTGAEIWRSLDNGGGAFHCAFSSPLLATVGAGAASSWERQLLVQTRNALCGLDPESGELLWSREIPAFRGMNILTPTVWQGQVFTSAYGGRGHLLQPQPTADGWIVEERWNQPIQGYMTSPVVIDDHAYLFLRANRVRCVDLETGESRWTSPPTGDEYWSLVAQGDRILALSNTGELTLLAADPTEFRVIDEVEIAEQETWAHLAVGTGILAVRELHALSLWEWSAE